MANPAAPVITGTIPFTRDGETYQTFYKLFGSLENCKRRPLVVLHGGPGFVHDYLLPFSDLAVMADTPVVLYDQLGNGLSTHLRDKPAEFWSIDFSLPSLRIWGGILAAEFAVQRRPRGLQHLVFTDSLASHSLWQESNAQLIVTFPPDIQAALKAGMADPKAYYDALLVFCKKHGCTVDPMPKEYLRVFEVAFSESGDPTVTSMMYPKLLPWSIIDRLHNIEVPTLVVNGADDVAQDFVVETFFQKNPKAKWITFANSSHTPFWEERELYMKRLADFLEL
ncbi:uncharacterized protein PHACADRAFT_182489 [Phanerochaete carnosa HHB-10118-sp]|uniref:AB hydrolase-1 domain-containing protein n=1 Tax=Phanerochaete carnosa (strain HHB-10118-sp) TaxID=650164 RepID=K5X5G2_PHACS|nr:uncharacterized protein PHACADRAFT_182489 [Phanerochaete carnosa HHB-10118-sp]EKM58102.1 hypothetical protein PHACADRAFT_182489 [Phanerochaete carnosa HHB-10118-sp]